MTAESQRKLPHLLWDPFKRISSSRALFLGLGVLLIGGVAAEIGDARYPGLISLQFAESTHWVDGFMDQILSICVAAIVFYIAAFLSGARNFLLIDLMSFFMVARLPLLILPLANYNGWLHQKSLELTGIALEGEIIPEMGESVLLLLVSTVMIFLLIWTIVLLFNAYQFVTNLKGISLLLSFIAAMILTLVITYFLTPESYVI